MREPNWRNIYISLACNVVGGLMALVGFFWVRQLMFWGVMVVLLGTACFPWFKRRR